MTSFSIIIPSYNDSHYIKSKIDNIMQLRYSPLNVQIIIAIGGSTKSEINIINNAPYAKVVKTIYNGKIRQINNALTQSLGDIVVVTDIDATMTHDALFDIEEAFKDNRVMCVGLKTNVKGMFIDRMYWNIANKIRKIESDIVSASHVVAPCYAFRRSFLKQFPDDVIADDVYAAMLANSHGFKVKYITTSTATEHRSPMTIKDFYRHKSRKGNAVLRELLRFLHTVNTMNPKFLVIYFIRLFQFTILTPTILLMYIFTKQGSDYAKLPS